MKLVSSTAAHAAASAAYPLKRRSFFFLKPRAAAVPNPPKVREVLCDRNLHSHRPMLIRLLPWAQP